MADLNIVCVGESGYSDSVLNNNSSNYCKGLGSADYVKNTMAVIPGPSKRPSLPL